MLMRPDARGAGSDVRQHRGTEAATFRPGSIAARLQATGLVLGLEPLKSNRNRGILRPINLNSEPWQAISDGVLLIVLAFLAEPEKVALVSTCKMLLSEQRRLKPPLAPRRRCSLQVLVGARHAGWTISHCYVDKPSGSWVVTRPAMSSSGGQSEDALRDLQTLSIVGRPDCALLVLSPFTDLSAMRFLSVLEFDSCCIGNAGVGVLAAAVRNGAVPVLRVLDLRRNQIGDGGAQALATALTHHTTGGSTVLTSLETLGLDSNCIFARGTSALASALLRGSVPSLRQLFVDDPEHELLREACDARRIDLSSW